MIPTEVRLLEAIEDQNNDKIIDHIFIFHSLLYAFVIAFFIKDLFAYTLTLGSIQFAGFQGVSTVQVFLWKFFLICFLLESWWGLWNDRFNIKINFLSFLITIVQPIFLYVMYRSIDCPIFVVEELGSMSLLFYIVAACDIGYIIMLKSVCYRVYDKNGPSVQDRRLIIALLMFITLFNAIIFFQWESCTQKLGCKISYYILNYFVLVFAYVQLIKFIKDYRIYDYPILRQKVKVHFISRLARSIYLLLKYQELVKPVDKEAGFGLLKIELADYDIDVFFSIVKKIKAFDDFKVIKSSNNRSYNLYLFLPYLKKESDFLIVQNRILSIKEIKAIRILKKEFLTFDSVRADIDFEFKKNKVKIEKGKSQWSASSQITMYVRDVIERWSISDSRIV